ncbi:primosomal replication protein N [Aliidiomarina sedimenti]|uniref:Replication restart protein PriB n=2 Tax=Aliidiomarina TaxID=1249554 RepID=A0A432WDB2_9GAMM|nr:MULTISPECIES: primosomal replication protein N [Aliidiomarina]RUO30071.1 primosomal replication protein N [Aliidiomarina sedimenti]RUO30400.1 primosomal replication protein N [Aliidiomarina soli]
MLNRLVLQGEVVKPPRVSKSPAGIAHLHLVIDHRSQQQEAGMARQCFLRIQVVASGAAAGDVFTDSKGAQDLANQLTVGSVVEVAGFLNRHETSSGVAKLVLHAQQLKKI